MSSTEDVLIVCRAPEDMETHERWSYVKMMFRFALDQIQMHRHLLLLRSGSPASVMEANRKNRGRSIVEGANHLTDLKKTGWTSLIGQKVAQHIKL